MLSGETAVGHDPVAAVRDDGRIAARADDEFDYDGWAPHLADLVHIERRRHDARVTDTMTDGRLAGGRGDGRRRHPLHVPHRLHRAGDRPFPARSAKLLAFSPDERTVRQLTMSWGAIPMILEQRGSNEAMVRAAVRGARESGHVRSGDTVVVLAGSDDRSRATDVLRLVRVP